jgi:NitT/TauT family transport system substrate-binding protein
MVREGDGRIVFTSREIPRAICDVLFVKANIARKHPDVIDHWIKAWDDTLYFKASDSQNYFQTLSQLNGTPLSELEDSFDGIHITNLAENRMAFGTQKQTGYLLKSLEEMQNFMLEQHVIYQPLVLQDMLDFEAARRFFHE